MNSFRLSYFGLIVFFSFIILLLISRVLFPFSDEPDWTVRAPRVIFGEHPVWSPYYLFSDFLGLLNIQASICKPVAGALSVWAEISRSCIEDIEGIVTRFLITLFITFPIVVIFVFRRFFIRLMGLANLRLSEDEWNHRIDSLALTIVFPSVLYYLGVLAEEQLFLVVALYVFLFWGFWLPVSFLLMILSSIDFGNTVVVLFFMLSMVFFSKVRSLNRNLFFIFLILCLVFSFFVGYQILELFTGVSFLGESFSLKSDAMYRAFDSGGLVEKYPIILRPIVTFMSFIFMTPSGVKVPILYVAVCFFILKLTLNVFGSKNRLLDIYWFVSLFSIIFLVFLFPSYGNAKYYIFMMPFLVYVSLNFYSRKSIFIFFIFLSLLVFLHLILYQL